MAKDTVEILIEGGSATPGPPLGPALDALEGFLAGHALHSRLNSRDTSRTANQNVLHPVRRHGVRQHHCPQAVPGYDWNRRGRCGQHCRVRRAGAAFWRNGCRGRPGSGQCNDVFVPHCDRAVLLPHHPQLQPDDLRLFAGGGCGRDRRGVRPQFYHQVCFNCSNPVYLL